MTLQEIAQLYEQNIHTPDHKPATQYLLCPVGLVGAGKTTVVRPLSEKLSLVRVSSDEIRKILKERNLGYENLPEIAKLVADFYLSRGYSLCIDADCSGTAARPLIQEAVDKYYAVLVWIHINPPEEFILNKLQSFKHTWLFENADQAIANYYTKKPTHAHLNYPFTYKFDPSRRDLQEQIEEAARIIREKVGDLN